MIFFKKKTNPCIILCWSPRSPRQRKDGACWLIGSLSVCPCLGTQLTAQNPRREGQILESLTKQRYGEKKRDEVIKKGFLGILLARLDFLPLPSSSLCLCHPSPEQRRPRRKAELFELPGTLVLLSPSGNMEQGRYYPTQADDRLWGHLPAWGSDLGSSVTTCHSPLILLQWLKPGFLLPSGSQHLKRGWETINLGITDTRLLSAAALCTELGDK